MIPSDEQLSERVRKIIAEILQLPVEEVTPDSVLGAELGATSMDFVETQFRLEVDFEVEFYKGSVVEKLAEIFAPQKLEAGGLLTPFGATVLRMRMPEIDPARLFEGKPVAGIEAMYTPRTWVRVVKELLNAGPKTCPNCGSDQVQAVKPSVSLCQKCRTEIRRPSGEECIEAWARSAAESLQSVHNRGAR
jgi:acyl carrier protein